MDAGESFRAVGRHRLRGRIRGLPDDRSLVHGSRMRHGRRSTRYCSTNRRSGSRSPTTRRYGRRRARTGKASQCFSRRRSRRSGPAPPDALPLTVALYEGGERSYRNGDRCSHGQSRSPSRTSSLVGTKLGAMTHAGRHLSDRQRARRSVRSEGHDDGLPGVDDGAACSYLPEEMCRRTSRSKRRSVAEPRRSLLRPSCAKHRGVEIGNREDGRRTARTRRQESGGATTNRRELFRQRQKFLAPPETPCRSIYERRE